MIASFRHKGLRKLFEQDDRRLLNARDVEKIARILQRLNRSRVAEDMNVPGFHFHRLKGDLKGFWAVTVRANWRIVFRMEDGHAWDVDLTDYH
jgi:toxin HigB-1